MDATDLRHPIHMYGKMFHHVWWDVCVIRCLIMCDKMLDHVSMFDHVSLVRVNLHIISIMLTFFYLHISRVKDCMVRHSIMWHSQVCWVWKHTCTYVWRDVWWCVARAREYAYDMHVVYTCFLIYVFRGQRSVCRDTRSCVARRCVGCEKIEDTSTILCTRVCATCWRPTHTCAVESCVLPSRWGRVSEYSYATPCSRAHTTLLTCNTHVFWHATHTCALKLRGLPTTSRWRTRRLKNSWRRLFWALMVMALCPVRLVLPCVAACCSVLQRVALCCSVLQRVAACCSMLQRVVVWHGRTRKTYWWWWLCAR